ncbi:MAG: hypothetical protein LAP38_22640 [Acidobacteriia bacterium]|nr:hypothetical protein [Terriglobia bacterium]
MIAALAAGASYAEDRPVIQANIPFEFVAGTKTLPAGEYAVKRVNSIPILAIESSNHKSNILGIGTPEMAAQVQPQGRLVFHRYGNTSILVEMWGSRSADGFSLPQTALERKLIAKGAGPGETINVTAH